jgi:hypothetical protein
MGTGSTEVIMLSRRRVAGFVSGLLVVSAAGCATHRDLPWSATSMAGAQDVSSVAGVWEGQVWEMPTHYIQGVRSITLTIARDGSWTASSGGAQCASGTASVRGGLVVLGGSRTGPDYCMPHSLASADGRMRAVFDTSFKARETSAMIDLRRTQGPSPAQARTSR